MSFEGYTQGTFKEELKNRFLCLVEVDEQDILCYVPSSCRLSNFIEMKGRKVLLKPITATDSRTKYSLFAIKEKRRFIPINLSSINELMYRYLQSRKFSFLGKRESILREHTIQGYKCDLYIADTKTIIENKCILSFDSLGV